jgi:biopolymer transport protein ExbD
MKLKITHKPMSNFDMSSATDIMFLLLIYFMIAFSSGSQQALQLSLPESINSDNSLHSINITITSDLRFYLNNELVDKKKLPLVLRAKLEDDNHGIMIYADKSVPVEQVIFVADVAASLGMKTTIATSQKGLENG